MTRIVENINQDIKDGVIKNMDQSSQNVTGLELQVIPDETDHAQNVLLINKTLAESQEGTSQDKTEEQVSISAIENEQDDSHTFSSDV